MVQPDLSFLSTSKQIGWEQHLQNDLFWVKWDVKSQLSRLLRCLRELLVGVSFMMPFTFQFQSMRWK